MTPDQARQQIQTAIDALRRGDAAHARSVLTALIDGGAPPPLPWFLLAQACHGAGDEAGEARALDALLAQEPRHLAGLLMRGALMARRGDRRGASSFYRTALNIVAITEGELPPGLVPMVQSAQRYMAESQEEYAAFLRSRLEEAGLAGTLDGGPVADAYAMMLGRKELYLQQPTSFYYPGLPQRQFYERHEFPWIAEIEAAIPAMRDELLAVLDEEAGFDPYVRSNPDRPLPSNALLDDPSWGARYLWEYGQPVAAHAERAPAAMRALERAPMPVIDRRSPMALYSLLKPGTHIKPHNGLLNTRLICHIPLITNPDCGLRVGNETRRWDEGKALIFDDSIEHEAWNRGSATRVVLLFEIWRPEIGEDQRRALTALFEAINDYQGVPTDQG